MNETIHYISPISYITDVQHLRKHIKYIIRDKAMPIHTFSDNSIKAWVEKAKYEKSKRYDARVAVKLVFAVPNNRSDDKEFHRKFIEFLSEFFYISKDHIDIAVHRDNPENIHIHTLIYPRTVDGKKLRINVNDLKRLHREWDRFLEKEGYRVVRDEVEERLAHIGWRLHREPDIQKAYIQYKQDKKQKRVMQEELYKLRRESIISVIKESQDMVFEYSELFCRLEIERQEREATKKIQALDMLLSQLQRAKVAIGIEYNIRKMEERPKQANQQPPIKTQAINNQTQTTKAQEDQKQTYQQQPQAQEKQAIINNQTQKQQAQEEKLPQPQAKPAQHNQSDLEKIKLILEIENEIRKQLQQANAKPIQSQTSIKANSQSNRQIQQPTAQQTNRQTKANQSQTNAQTQEKPPQANIQTNTQKPQQANQTINNQIQQQANTKLIQSSQQANSQQANHNQTQIKTQIKQQAQEVSNKKPSQPNIQTKQQPQQIQAQQPINQQIKPIQQNNQQAITTTTQEKLAQHIHNQLQQTNTQQQAQIKQQTINQEQANTEKQEERQEKKNQINIDIEAIQQKLRQEIRQAFRNALNAIDNGIERIDKKAEEIKRYKEQQAKQKAEQKANQPTNTSNTSQPKPQPKPQLTELTEDDILKWEILGIEPETETEESPKDTEEKGKSIDIDIDI